MCLQIYIKTANKFELAYVPDAKAFTDAPGDMMTLMKQRRRWMNGAFFGTKKVIGNFVNMISCNRTTHNKCKKIMMVFFMFYLASLYTFQFFIVGAMFASIYAFFDTVFNTIVDGNWALEDAYKSGLFSLLFAYIYIFLLVMVILLSLAMPLEKAKSWFYIVTTTFGMLTMFSIVGICVYLEKSGLYPPEKKYNPSTDDFDIVPDTYFFSYLVLAGIIMLSIYVVPMVMRPIDFLSNFTGYIVGLITYMLLIPMYINVFSIYAFSNLHDISWGNRPTTEGTGTEAHAQN